MADSDPANASLGFAGARSTPEGGAQANGPRAALAKVIPRRPRVTWWLGITLAAAFALLIIPSVTAERWIGGVGNIERGTPSPVTVRVPPFAGYGHTHGGGVLIARGEVPDRDTAEVAAEIERTMPHGAVPYLAFLLLVGVLAGLFTHHMRRSTYGRLLRVQIVSLALLAVAAITVKVVMLTTASSVLVVPVAVFAMVPTLVLDRTVGLATGTLAALIVSLLVPFDVGVAILLMVQAGAAGLVIAERPKKRLRAAVIAGAATTLFTAATYPLMLYLIQGHFPLDELRDPLHSTWIAATIGPALATVLTVATVPAYQLLVGEITQGKLVELEDLSHPLLKQIANKAPGTWQHSLTMANMAELAANAIGANGRLVRVGAYYHDLGKSLQPKYFIENLEPGETSPHDKLPPEVSCDAIFAHVTEGIVSARKAGLHERVIDFMHMHHGNGVLEYFWAKARENGNPRNFSVEDFRYPGVPPQSRETAILSICDAVEAAARTLKKPEKSAIDNLVQRIVYGKLHLGQLDESGLSMSDLRRVAESLRDTIKHANHGRIEYPWQKAQQSASAVDAPDKLTSTGPRLDSLDRPAHPDAVIASPRKADDAFAETDNLGATPNLKPRTSDKLATVTTAPVLAKRDSGDIGTAPVMRVEPEDETSLLIKMEADDNEVAAPVRRPDARAATDPGRAVAVAVPSGPMPSDFQETRPAPQFDEEEILELKPRPDAGALGPAQLAALATTQELDPQESDPRMRRVTNPVEEKAEAPEVAQFATDAQRALDQARKSRPEGALDRLRPPSGSAARPGEAGACDRDARVSAEPPASPDAPARTRAATLPPMRSQRAPTIPPFPAIANVTVPPPSTLRPPAKDLVIKHAEDGSVLIEPAKPSGDDAQPRLLRDETPISDRDDTPLDDRVPLGPRAGRPTRERELDAPAVMRAFDHAETASTQPAMARATDEIGDVTNPEVIVPAPDPSASWGQARFERQLDEDFGRETPSSPPTRAELQALMNTQPDLTRQQSIEEIERLHAQSREHTDPTRRAPFPTKEIEDSDIEAAIELAPPARRTALGVAKPKKPPGE